MIRYVDGKANVAYDSRVHQGKFIKKRANKSTHKLSMYKSLIELVNQYTENKGGLRSKLVVSHELEQDVYAGSNNLQPDYRELIWEIHPGTLNIGDRLGEGLSSFYLSIFSFS